MRFLCAIGYTAQMEDKSNIIYGDTIKISKGYRICRCGLLMEVVVMALLIGYKTQ